MTFPNWAPTSAACPTCGATGCVKVRQILKAKSSGRRKPGTEVKWQYRCSKCATEGDANPADFWGKTTDA
jgi:hypothetical protein